MAIVEDEFTPKRQRSHWVRLRTLVFLRWIAIAGQITALVVASQVFELQFETGLVSVVIGASVLANLFSTFLVPGNKRLSETEAVLMLLFDLFQLSLLLFLTGGLNNPFALLALVPVTIAATFLHLRSTILIGVLAILSITVIGWFHFVIQTSDGTELILPAIFRFGFWVALMIGVIFLGAYARQVTSEMHSMSDALLATQMALAREQKLTDLGGVVAAAAHELGTPLATIKLVSSELISEVSDNPDLLEDVRLIGEQADRCRDILRSMGRAGKEDLHLHRVPLAGVLQEAAEPHLNRGKIIHFVVSKDVEFPNRQPVILRRPEILHGLRNLIQNAVDFAMTTVEIESSWSANSVTVRIADDGRGYPTSIIGRIGDPFVRSRKAAEEDTSRPGYEGMGLGLFIAKTLLERSGAKILFANGGTRAMGGTDEGGALVLVHWDRDDIDPERDSGRGPLGQNRKIAI